MSSPASPAPTRAPASTTPTPAASSTGTGAEDGAANAAQACTLWQDSFSQPDPEWRQTETDAAALAQQAASADPQWQPLLDTMNQLLALSQQPDTDDTRAQGRTLNATLSEQCAPTGVTVKSA